MFVQLILYGKAVFGFTSKIIKLYLEKKAAIAQTAAFYLIFGF
jgi:hypothetical protein